MLHSSLTIGIAAAPLHVAVLPDVSLPVREAPGPQANMAGVAAVVLCIGQITAPGLAGSSRIGGGHSSSVAQPVISGIVATLCKVEGERGSP